MVTETEHNHQSRFALRPVFDERSPDGAWWPTNRSLTDQLDSLFAVWPSDRGRIARILYSPPDWDDRPHKVQVSGRMIKTGSFPRDDTHILTLTMSSGKDRTITVIPPETPPDEANQLLGEIAEIPRPDHLGDQWDNEGGHA